MSLDDGSINPRDAKLDLAKTLVRMYHSAQSAQRTAEDFQRVFTRRELPDKIDQYKVTKKNVNIVDLLIECKLMRSRGEAKRKIREGAIDVDGVRVDDINYIVELKQPIVVRAGKYKFLKVSKK